jgi:hypothetical protein
MRGSRIGREQLIRSLTSESWPDNRFVFVKYARSIVLIIRLEMAITLFKAGPFRGNPAAQGRPRPRLLVIVPRVKLALTHANGPDVGLSFRAVFTLAM